MITAWRSAVPFRDSPSLLLQLFVMLSRFSVLSAYLVASLVASTLATPMIGQSSGHGGDSMKKPYKHDYAQERPYAHHQANSCDVDKQQCCNQVTKVISSRFFFVFVFKKKTSYRQASMKLAICFPFLAAPGFSTSIHSSAKTVLRLWGRVASARPTRFAASKLNLYVSHF